MEKWAESGIALMDFRYWLDDQLTNELMIYWMNSSFNEWINSWTNSRIRGFIREVTHQSIISTRNEPMIPVIPVALVSTREVEGEPSRRSLHSTPPRSDA
jgi:hypothetical protein